MADKSFGVKQINLIGASGTPTIESPNNLNLNANTVAISTDVTIGGQVQSNLRIGSSYFVGIGTTTSSSKLDVIGNVRVTGVSTLGTGVTVSGTTFTNQLSVSGVSTFSGITTHTAPLFGTQSSFTGIVTASSFRPSSGYIQAADGTNSFFIYSGTGNVAFQGTIGATRINNGQGFTAINFNTISTPTVTIPNNFGVSGIATVIGNVGIGTTIPTSKLTVFGDTNIVGTITATSFSGSGAMQSRTVVSGLTTSIDNNGIGNTNITGFKSYALLRVGLSTAAWLRLYTDSTSRANDASRSIGIDPTPGSGVIAEVVTTGISTTQIITPFTIGGNLDTPVSSTIYAAITNLSGSTQAINAQLTILQLEV